MHELIGKRDSSFVVSYHTYSEKTGKLELVASCYFSFLNGDVIKTAFENSRGKKYRASYWKFLPNEGGDSLDSVVDCTPDGRVKERDYPTPHTFKLEKVGSDSIIEIRNGPILNKYIYHNNILIEKWYQYGFDESGNVHPSYTIEKYSYVGDTTYTEYIFVSKDGKQTSQAIIKDIKNFNNRGQLISHVFGNNTGEYRYYYRADSSWYKTEHWTNGELYEVTEKKTIILKSKKPR